MDFLKEKSEINKETVGKQGSSELLDEYGFNSSSPQQFWFEYRVKIHPKTKACFIFQCSQKCSG